MRLIESLQIVSGFAPVDMQTGANTGDWVSLANYNHVAAVLFKAIGTAGDDPTITCQQATDNAGTGAKALNFTTLHVKQGADLTAIGQFTKITQASANTYTEATSAEAQAIWVVEFDAQDLDVANGFDHFRVTVADIGANAQLGCLLYLLSEPRFHEALLQSAL